MGKHAAVTEAEMDGLSDAEREALLDDATDTAAADAATAADDDTPEGADTTGDDDDAPADEDAADAAAPEKATPPSDEDADISNTPVDEESPEAFIPRYIAEPVANYEGQMAALDKQFDDADISLKEYNTQRDALIRKQTKAEIAAEQDEQMALQRWDWEVKHFIKDAARSEGIDYNQPLLNAAFDAAVKALGSAKDADGKLMHADKEGEWFLNEAHKQVKDAFGLGKQIKVSSDAQELGAKQRQTRAGIPKTLASIPAAEIPETGNTDPFASIDKLFADGRNEEAEMKLAGLSKADQSRYLHVSS